MHFFPRYKNLWRGFFVIFAGMKRPVVIGLFLLLALTACHHKGPEPVEGPTKMDLASPELSAIDSLMWQRPDSALLCLIPWFDTCRDGVHTVSTDYNRHYANLLLAELLYKNDYAQTNRAELQQAVAYFDSLVRQTTPPTSLRAKRGNPREPGGLKTPNPTDNLFFLSARAHYINGVGHYEQGQATEACAEYLKALETMESHFGEKELVGKKAKFMAYTYNRLGEMFSAQFMMEPAIACYEQSLAYCRIAPTSPFGVSNTLYRLGLQYDKLGQKEKAMEYYEQALEALPVMEGPLYRDIVTNKALCDYQLGLGLEQPLDALRQILAQAMGEDEMSARNIVIGDIFFEEGLYDSALVYLEPVFEHDESLSRRIRAADFLRIIYDSMGQKDKADDCMRFLATQKKSEGEYKALVSQLEGLFQAYLNQKQEQKAAQEKREAVRRTVRILVPIALAVAAVVVLVVRKRGKKRLTKQAAEAQRRMAEKTQQHAEAMEAEQQAHRMEQAALSGRLKRSNEKLRDVSKQLEQSLAKNTLLETESPDDYSAFAKAPICLYIIRMVHEQGFKAKIDYLIYKESALSKEQLLALRDAAGKHLARFVTQIRAEFPNLTDSDMDYCYLFLLGLNEADVSALMQRAYTTVCDRSRKISRIIGANDSLYQTLRNRLSER